MRHRLEHALYRAVRFGLGLLPKELGRSMGGAFGFLAYLIGGRRRRTGLDNLAHALPELDRAA